MQLMSPSEMCPSDGSELNHDLTSLNESHDFVPTVLTAGHQGGKLQAIKMGNCFSNSTLANDICSSVSSLN